MLKRIEPKAIICYCDPFPEMKGNIIKVDYAQTNNLSQQKKFWTISQDNSCYKTAPTVLPETPPETNSHYVTKTCGYVVTAGMGGGGGGGSSNSHGGEKNGSIPEKANKLAQQIKERNGSPPPGYKGGRIYRNEPENGGQKLPDGVKYREYDVNPYSKGTDRGSERIVIGDDGSVWYTNDHYHTFTQMN